MGEFFSSPQGSRVIAVTSGKGGVGKTSLVVNLSLALSRLGKRVIILDADLGLANVEVLMGVSPLYTLFDCLSGRKEINEILMPGPLGVQIISGGAGFIEMANLSSRQQQKIMDSLTLLDAADFVLIDTGAGISRNVLGFVAAAEEVIVVLTPEPTSLTDAYTLIKILAKFKVHQQVMLVVNQAVDEREAAATWQKISAVAERFLEVQLHHLGSIYEDRVVSRAVRHQQPFALFARQSGPALSVEGMARYLVNGRDFPGRKKTFSGFIQKIIRIFR